jgi:mannose-6-phosphate isomerase-like protein (cupin superfamily)
MENDTINLNQKFSLFNSLWHPKILGELNGQHIKIFKAKGEFDWHKHDNEDELFFIWKGTLDIEFRNKTITLNEGEMLIIPKGTEHKPVAKEEVHVILFESVNTINTGDNPNSTKTQQAGWI